MTDPPAARLAAAGRELKAIEQENSALEARWLELTEAIEQPAMP